MIALVLVLTVFAGVHIKWAIDRDRDDRLNERTEHQ